jgi:Flp pilus assembly protein TadD
MLSVLLEADAREGVLAQGRAEHHVPHPRAEVYTKRAREALTGIGTSSGLAAEMLEQAIALDPEYALAHAIHAEACAAAFCTGHADAKWIDRAQASLDRAESLDPTLPDLRVARARMLWTKTFNFPAETALRELKLALRKEPTHTGALRLFATITGHVGLFEHTEISMNKLRGIDPKDPVVLAVSASLNIFRGRAQAAIDELDPMLRLDPKHEEVTFWWIYGHALTLLGRLDQAEITVRDTLKRHPEDPLALSLAALVRAMRSDAKGSRTFARSVERSIKSEMHPHHAYQLLACAESVLGDVGAAIEWLGRCANEGMPCFPWFDRDPLLDNLRRHAEGAALMETLHRRHQFFEREFPLIDRGTTLSYVATEVPDR